RLADLRALGRSPSGTARTLSRNDVDPAVVESERRAGSVREDGRGQSSHPHRAVRWTVREDLHHGGPRQLPDHDLRKGPATVLASEEPLTSALRSGPRSSVVRMRRSGELTT